MNNSRTNFSDLVKKMGFDETKESIQESMKEIEKKEEPINNMQPKYPKSDKVTVIAEDIIITGDLKAQQDIEFYGEIKGNIETAGTLKLNGAVEGNIKANNLIIQKAQIKGNVVTENQISIDKDTAIVGDLSAKTITVGGNLKGNISAEATVLIQEEAVITGDVSTYLIDIRQGAKINGKIEMGSKKGKTAQ